MYIDYISPQYKVILIPSDLPVSTIVPPEEVPREGIPYTLTCESDARPLADSYTWWHDDELVDEETEDTLTLTLDHTVMLHNNTQYQSSG